MLEAETFVSTEEKEFINGFIPGVSISVDEDNMAKVFMKTWPQGLEWTQDQVTEMIGLLVQVHDYMDMQNKGEETMPLFNDIEDNVEEIEYEVDEISEIKQLPEYDEITGNATAFLYMKEDLLNQRISKEEMLAALHILRDSIDSYLNSSIAEDHGTEEEQPEQTTEPTEE